MISFEFATQGLGALLQRGVTRGELKLQHAVVGIAISLPVAASGFRTESQLPDITQFNGL